jgi:hypothetical protein
LCSCHIIRLQCVFFRWLCVDERGIPAPHGWQIRSLYFWLNASSNWSRYAVLISSSMVPGSSMATCLSSGGLGTPSVWLEDERRRSVLSIKGFSISTSTTAPSSSESSPTDADADAGAGVSKTDRTGVWAIEILSIICDDSRGWVFVGVAKTVQVIVSSESRITYPVFTYCLSLPAFQCAHLWRGCLTSVFQFSDRSQGSWDCHEYLATG